VTGFISKCALRSAALTLALVAEAVVAPAATKASVCASERKVHFEMKPVT